MMTNLPGVHPGLASVQRHVELFVALTLAAILVLWNLDAEAFVGDELNALFYMRDGLLEYLTTFHYGTTIKIQFWVMHQLFGNELHWYRVPAAVSAVLACACLFIPRFAFLPGWTWSRLFVVSLLIVNTSFLYFARWSMPNYAEGIAVSSLLVALILRGMTRNGANSWTAIQLLCISVLPWLYPPTIILLGGISVFLVAEFLFARIRQPGTSPASAKALVSAMVPLALGLLNLAANLLLRSSDHWNRARSHHLTFSKWASETGGDWPEFVFRGIKGLVADLIDTPAVAATRGAELFQEVHQIMLVIAAVAVMAAPVLAWRDSRHSGTRGPVALLFLRAYAFLGIALLSGVAVTSLASLVDAFPIGSIRYVFFFFPLLGFLTLVSVSYCSWFLGSRIPPLFAAMLNVMTGLAVVAFASLAVHTLVSHRATVKEEQHSIMEAMTDPMNRAVIAWDPGFFFPAALLPKTTTYFHVGHERKIPSGLIQAIWQENAPSSDAIAIFSRRSSAFDGSGQLHPSIGEFIAAVDYHLDRRLNAGPYTVLRFEPNNGTDPRERAVSATLDLPPGRIHSIRIQPTELRDSRVTITELSLDSAGTGFQRLEICSDKSIQLVRTEKLQMDSQGSCVFRFGNDAGSGWFVPGTLRNLSDTGQPRRLRIRAEGELGLELQTYLDLGMGYSSKDMMRSPTVPR